MKLLEERILKDGHILGDNILKVDSFLTHQVDFSLMREIGKVFAEKFAAAGITKIAAVSIAAGVGLNNSNLFVSMPTAFQMFFSNGIVVASLLAIVLNAVLNHKKK